MKATQVFALGASLSLISGAAMAEANLKDVLANYANIAHAGYSDSLVTAKAMQEKINAFVKEPTEANLKAAKEAWVAAREPYQQTEVYRFGNAIVDEWEGKVNAWPLDEGLIDYVDTGAYGTESDENPLYNVNVIATPEFKIGDKTVDAKEINKALLQELHEADGVEANVTTGYHAVEFLLWGQDLNGTNAGAGARPASDFDANNCTNGNCERRAQYLTAATDLLIDDLNWMTAQWAEDGEARQGLMADEQAGLVAMLTGMGSLSYGELAGERMKLGVLLHDPEEEHDCFSDNTDASHYFDAKGIQNVYVGSYTRIDGTEVSGPSLSQLVAAKDAGVDEELKGKLAMTMDKMQVLVDEAKGGKAYDQLLAEGDDEGNAKVMAAVDALVAQTKSIEKATQALGIATLEIEGSDSLDAPEAVTGG